jgi:hypothetical protein
MIQNDFGKNYRNYSFKNAEFTALFIDILTAIKIAYTKEALFKYYNISH